MKKGIALATVLLTVTVIIFGIKVFVKDEESVERKKSSEYLEDPEAYMEDLKEQYEVESDEHEHEPGNGQDTHEKTLEYYENLKDEWVQKDYLIMKDDNYIPMMIVLDKFHESFEGKKIELIGFVYREPDFSEDQFVIGRRGNPCCVEDTEGIYGLLSTTPRANEFSNDQWVKVTGTLSRTEYFAIEVPYLKIEEIIPIEAPEDPYVYEEES
jgi:putative membrane protein